MSVWKASDLQWGLVALGVIIVLLVWLYNRWQASRSQGRRRLAEPAVSEGTHLPEAEAIEPAGRVEPVIGGVTEEEDSPPPVAPAIELADPAIDCLISLTPREELAAPVFWQAQRQYLSSFIDRLRWLGWHKGQWRLLDPHDAGMCSAFMAALQLADRSGPVDEATLRGLTSGVGALAAAIGAEVHSPEIDAVLAQARALDEFCASVDWRIALNLVPPAGKSLAADSFESLIQAGQFEQRNEGLWHAEDAAGQTQFVIAALGGLPFGEEREKAGLTLTIDVPLTPDGGAAFERLLSFAGDFAKLAPVDLVDDARRPLTEAALTAIHAKIGEFQKKMDAAAIPAGGRRAMRLYA